MDIDKVIVEAIKSKIRSILGDIPENDSSEMIGVSCVIRTCSAGVFIGKITKESILNDVKEVILDDCIRVHYWDGACSLSQMAIDGVSKPENCRFSVKTNGHKVMNVIEMIPITKKARENLYGVKKWKK